MAQRKPAPAPTDHPENAIIPAFASTLKRMTNKTAGFKIWQRGYYEHIIRTPEDYYSIIQYITDNPAGWLEDEYNG